MVVAVRRGRPSAVSLAALLAERDDMELELAVRLAESRALTSAVLPLLRRARLVAQAIGEPRIEQLLAGAIWKTERFERTLDPDPEPALEVVA